MNLAEPAASEADSHRPADLASNPLRLLMVHAHPDDETTTTGATSARYAAEGIGVHLVTCTRGERGEILDDALVRGLAGLAPDDAAMRLGEHRSLELTDACVRLRFTDWRFLAGSDRWWDSGMADTPTAKHPKAFSAGDLDSQAGVLATIIRRLRPQVVVTYDERGGYGHPDHIRAHEITMAAVRRAADGVDPGAGTTAAGGEESENGPRTGGSWRVSKVYACVVPRSQLTRAAVILAASDTAGPNPLAEVAATGDLPFAVPDDQVAARIDARAWLAAKADAMRAHRSQMPVNGWFFTLIERGAFDFEYYRLIDGLAAPPSGESWEDDLFAGLRGRR